MMLAGANDQQQGSPCVCKEGSAPLPAPAGTPFLQQVLLSVTVAVVTTLVIEKVLGRKR